MSKFADSLKRYFEETPQDKLDRDWEVIKPLNDIGPDVIEYIEQVRMHYYNIMQNMQDVPITNFSQDNFKTIDEYYLAA